MPTRTTKTTTQRGLGHAHQKRRAHLLRRHIDGTACGHCGQPMWRTEDLDADHTIARSLGGTSADRLLHSTCNRSRGDGTRTASDDRRRWTTRDW